MSVLILDGQGNADWAAMLKSVTDAVKTDGTSIEDPTVKMVDGNVVITVCDAATGETREATLSTVPIIDGEDDEQEVGDFLESVAGKIDELIDELKQAVLEAGNGQQTGSANIVGTSIGSSGVQKVLFDLYEIIQLMQKLGQQQRDTARKIRSGELQMQASSIQSQADHQRKAAMLGAIVSAVTCAAQVAMISYSAYKTVQANKALNTTSAGQQLASSQQDLSMLSAKDADLQNLVDKKGALIAKMDEKFGTHAKSDVDAAFDKVTTDLEGKIKLPEARAKVADLQKQVETNKAQLETVEADIAKLENRPGSKPPEPPKPGQEVELQEGLSKRQIFELTDHDLGARIETLSAEVYENPLADPPVPKADAPKVKLDELTALKEERSSRAELATLRESKTALETDKTKLEGELKAAQDDLDTKQAEFNEQLPGELDKLMADYDTKFAAARASASLAESEAEEHGGRFLSNDADKAKVAAQQDVKTTADIRAYVKGKVIQAKREVGATDSLKVDKQEATARFERQEVGVTNDRGYKTAMASAKKWEVLSGLPNALNGVFQSISQFVARDEEVQGTREQAEQTKWQQYRDETQQLFQQAQDLVTNSRQLLQAVIEAESRTVEQIIRA